MNKSPTIIRKLCNMASNKNLASLRMKYNDKNHVFLENSIEVKEPMNLFDKWLKLACSIPEIYEPNGMLLTTATKCGIPSARMVLLKDVTEDGFTFFTNYGSNKAKEIEENPNVALTFYWPLLHRSVRVQGTVAKVSKTESETYFHERPRASQIGALASPQSQLIPSRDYLDKIENEIKEKYDPNAEIPLPNWGGYLVTPNLVEFWQGQSNRLHDRIRFRRNAENEVDNELIHAGENGWVYERLAP